MSEQYPLLCEEVSDEDKFSPRIQRRRLTTLRGRAKYHMKGAAAIMTRWPEHWTSLLIYWWIGLGMIALISLIIYNSLFSIAVLQSNITKPTKYASFKTNTHKTKPSSPGVFMHVFVNDKEEEDLNTYLPYIEVFANKYKDFTYNLIIVANDTSEETSNLTDETNNAIALNSLWTNDVNYGNIVPSNSHVNVKYVTLSKYLNDSPIQKHWKNMPHQFIRFLVRAVSVWDKGGIAANPIILTPQSPHPSYMEKLVSIVKNFKKSEPKSVTEEQKISIRKHNKIPAKVNNIRDIINALDHDESSDLDYSNKEILQVAESRNILIETSKENKLTSSVGQELTTDKQTTPYKKYNLLDLMTTSDDQEKNTSNKEDRNENLSNLVPLFWNYLFHNNKPKSLSDTTHSMKKRRSPNMNEVPKDVNNKDIQMRNFWNDIKSSDNYKPVIVSAKGVPNNTATIKHNSKPTYRDNDKLFELTIDLKGNIIATETLCHAFIGNVFTNAIHHDVSESLTDFIIKELSFYCKGLLTSCMGIDVILV